ncbi:PREDICTED: uncharacterized protein LOC108555390 [Eufriesea mexicana]|uniref:uncharacterized protein LOC108555390 n=1 Tax=Eufriesea mexicana TaxID=516756 RepID=UPI00083C4DE7|nr:PREDICTED: uncharacterized protein LOC108555390 [Eufriesea mexicana]
MRGKETRSSRLYDRGTANDEIPKDWSKTKDLCSFSDWLNSKKSSGNEQGKSGDRWIRDYETSDKGRPDSSAVDKGANAKAAVAFNARNQRDETTRKEAPSLESLKETILELKKSLNAADKKREENSKNVDAGKVGEKDGDRHEQKEGTSRARNKYRKNENDDETGSGWWEGSLAEKLDLKKREQGPEDLEEKNARPKVWRTKRTEVNNDDGNPKLFRRVGFGEPYLEENTPKEPRDRKRRSKGTPSDEKRRLNEAPDKNADTVAEEKNSMKISETAADYERADNSGKKGPPPSDSRGTGVLERESELTNSPEDAANSGISEGPAKEERKNTETAGNCEESDLSRENLNAMENELTRKKGKGESPEGNSLQTFESMTNELQAASSATETSSQENVGSSKGEQVIKVFEPQRHLHENSERTKEVRRTEPDEEHGKLSRQLVQEKRSTGESGNINILLESENKNLVKFSNACNKDGKLVADRSPFVLNVYDVKKKMILEDEDKPGKSVSTIYKMKLEKAQVDTPASSANKRRESQGGDDGPISNGVPDFEKNKVKEVPYEDTPGSANIMKERKLDEKRLKNFIDSDKGSEQSGVNEEGTRNWFEGAARNQMGMNVDHGAAENCNELGGKDKFTDAEGGRFNDEKGDSSQDPNNKAGANEDNDEGRNNKKYRQIFIMTDGMDDRIMSDRYGQRRILQYMEYSNDDVEDVDVNYDREENDDQRRASIEKDEAPSRRKERAAYSDKKKAKVNMLIREKLDRKKKPSRGRKKRDPNVIAYYDYDSDVEQQDREALSPTIDERSKDNYRDKNAAQESDTGLGNHACTSPSAKF